MKERCSGKRAQSPQSLVKPFKNTLTHDKSSKKNHTNIHLKKKKKQMEDKMTTTLQARNTSKFNLLAKQE